MKRGLLALLLLVVVGCGGDDDDPTGGNTTTTVQMNAATFSPSEVTISRGSTVRWVNAAAIAHTITPTVTTQAGVWGNVNVPAQQNFTFSHTFNTAGTFNYVCNLHAGMTGRVTVQ